MEQVKMSPKGFMFTRGPGNYKIPGFGDIPIEFNVTLLKGSVNEKAVYSSKVTVQVLREKKKSLKMVVQVGIFDIKWGSNCLKYSLNIKAKLILPHKILNLNK